jgi:ubiquinone/menaquinone biosynthesis C-methylase UbiE
VKLHLGCGDKYIPGFKHLDLREAPHIDFLCSIDKLTMIKDNSVELIYACHVLEHFKRFETAAVLQEWFRALAPGGVLRLAVPDFEAIVKIYQETKNLDSLMGLLFGGQDYQYNFHFRIFDFLSIEKLLLSVGFKEVHRYEWRDTEHRDLDDFSQAYIPHMAKDTGTLMSLNVEAIK